MNKKQIIDAYITIRATNNTIPDDVLDFMKLSAIERLEKNQQYLHNKLISYDDALYILNLFISASLKLKYSVDNKLIHHSIICNYPYSHESINKNFCNCGIGDLYYAMMMHTKHINWEKKTIKYSSGTPCEHPGCSAHISHPCENCGRIGTIGDIYEVDWEQSIKD